MSVIILSSPASFTASAGASGLSPSDSDSIAHLLQDPRTYTSVQNLSASNPATLDIADLPATWDACAALVYGQLASNTPDAAGSIYAPDDAGSAESFVASPVKVALPSPEFVPLFADCLDSSNATAGSNTAKVILPALQNETAVQLMFGKAHRFPCLPDDVFTPAPYQQQTTYHNNTSTLGQWVGRAIIRQSSSVKVQPLSFITDTSRLQELYALFAELRAGPCYLMHDGPGGSKWVYYGWTEDEPTLQYIANETQVQVNLTLRCPA